MAKPKWLDPTKKSRKRSEKLYRDLSPEEKKIRGLRSMASAAKKPEQKRLIGRSYVHRLRVRTMAAYGGCCTCCGEREPSFLSIDHVNNDGAAHRRLLNGRVSQKGVSPQLMFVWAKRKGYPETLQILCHNCNMAKAFYGVCPHESMRRLAGEG